MIQLPVRLCAAAARLYRSLGNAVLGRISKSLIFAIAAALLLPISNAKAQSLAWVDPPTDNYMVGAKILLQLTGIYHPSTVQIADGNTIVGNASVGICNNYPTNCNYWLMWTVPSSGSHTLTAAVTSPSGTQFPPAITVIAEASAAPSIAITSPPQNQLYIAGTPGYDITVSASASSSNSTITGVEFFKDDGSTVQGNGSNGNYTIPLRVSNGYDLIFAPYMERIVSVYAIATDASGKKTVSVPLDVRVGSTYRPSVGIGGPTTILVPAGSPLTVPISVGVTSQVSASVVRIELYEDNILKTAVDNPSSAQSPSYYVNYTPADNNYHNLYAMALDSQGALGTSNTISIRVQYAPAPVVTMLSPDPSETWTLPTSGPLNQQLMARVQVPQNSGGWINSVDFYDGSQLLGPGVFSSGNRGGTAQFAYDWNNIPAGIHSITALATMSAGINVTGRSDPVVMNVTAPSPPSIYEESPRDITTATQTPRIRALLSSSSSTINVANTRLFVDGVNVSAQAQISAAQVLWVPAAPIAQGLHQVRVETADANGLTASKDWQFTIALPPPPPTQQDIPDGVRSPISISPSIQAAQ